MRGSDISTGTTGSLLLTHEHSLSTTNTFVKVFARSHLQPTSGLGAAEGKLLMKRCLAVGWAELGRQAAQLTGSVRGTLRHACLGGAAILGTGDWGLCLYCHMCQVAFAWCHGPSFGLCKHLCA